MSLSLRRVGAMALGLALLAGCSQDRAAGPAGISEPSAASHGLLGGLVGAVTAPPLTTTPLHRTTPLAAAVTVSQLVGPDGGTLAIPAAGVTVTVPAGALDRATTITMTARAGSLLAYDFAPHGITFAKPLTLTQSLAGTSATLLGAPTLRLGYYTDASLLSATTATVTELLGGVVNTLGWSFSAPVRHFSGYLVCWNGGDALE